MIFNLPKWNIPDRGPTRKWPRAVAVTLADALRPRGRHTATTHSKITCRAPIYSPTSATTPALRTRPNFCTRMSSSPPSRRFSTAKLTRTPVAYLGALMMSLQAEDSRTEPAVYAGMLTLLERTLSPEHVPRAVLLSKAPRIASALVGVTNAHAEHPPVLKGAALVRAQALWRAAVRRARIGRFAQALPLAPRLCRAPEPQGGARAASRRPSPRSSRIHISPSRRRASSSRSSRRRRSRMSSRRSTPSDLSARASVLCHQSRSRPSPKPCCACRPSRTLCCQRARRTC